MEEKRDKRFEDIVEIMRFLRSPDGCDWDRSKNARDMKPYILEECHELLEAIDREDTQAVIDELGDLLLLCAFLAAIGEEKGHFSSRDLFSRLDIKIKNRHAHLFCKRKTDAQAESWELIKGRERQKEGRTSILDGIPASLPPLLQAFRLQERAAGWKFDWSTPDGALDKVEEEIDEVKRARQTGDPVEVENEIGDLLFAVVNLSRLLGAHPGEALSRTIKKFTRRFDRLSIRAHDSGLILGEATLEELDEIWEMIKKEENENKKEL
jgi:tetrapyrrole methylase family protein/MazG family protein